MKHIFFLLSFWLALLSGCVNINNQNTSYAAADKKSVERASLNENIGWIHGACLAIKNNKLKPGTNIQVIVLSNPQKLLAARVTGRTESGSGCPALLSDRSAINKQEGRFFYQLDLDEASQDIVAIGLVSTSVKVRTAGPIIDLDVNNEGITVHAGSCTTSEGMQFFIASGNTFNENALWSDYYYLGYDTMPTCP